MELTRAEKLMQTGIKKYGSEEAWRKAMADQGRRGGKAATGNSKRRGDATYYQQIGQKGGLNRGKATNL